jgi:hypothetical protein
MRKRRRDEEDEDEEEKLKFIFTRWLEVTARGRLQKIPTHAFRAIKMLFIQLQHFQISVRPLLLVPSVLHRISLAMWNWIVGSHGQICVSDYVNRLILNNL